MTTYRSYSRLERFKFWLVAQVAARLVRTMFRTCRVEILRPDLVDKYFNQGRAGIGVTWHRGAIFSLYYFGPKHPGVLISGSRDGEYLARYLAVMGGIPVRGSSSRGGMTAIKDLAEFLEGGPGRYVATGVDGPRGPRYVAKRGMIALAAQTGLPVVPLLWSAKRVWVLKNTWDHTMIPKPFAKVVFGAGKELRYPPDIKGDELNAARQEMEDELNRLKDELDAISGYREPA